MDNDLLLDVKNLVVHYETEDAIVEAVNDISFQIHAGETFGLVGETGAGKTTTALSILRLIPSPPGRIIQGEIRFRGENIVENSEAQMRKLRGNHISMIFQDPMTALNPALTIGEQVAEVIRVHHRCSKLEAAKRATEMLEMVGISAERYRDYPHQFSGGMKQRVVIATALACNPQLLIADEPTTALDVTIEKQILEIFKKLKHEKQMSFLIITHNFGIVAEIADRVGVLYAGELVEMADVYTLFRDPRHPYTQALMRTLPRISKSDGRLETIGGIVPRFIGESTGCRFANRCKYCTPRCKSDEAQMVELEKGHFVKCHKVVDANG